MASLTGQQINNSYLGLLKTNTNGAIVSGFNALSDGAGNALNLSLDAAAGLQFEGPTSPQLFVKQTSWTKANYPMSPTAGQFAAFTINDTAGADVFSISQDRYGSAFYKNINGDDGEAHVFQSQTSAGVNTNAKIAINTYNNVNNSDNWFQAWQNEITAGSYDSGTSDLTLTRPNAADIVVNIPTGGGGGTLAAQSIDTLPPIKSDTLAAKSWKNGETVLGYTFQNTVALTGTNAIWKVMPIGEGEQITSIYYNVRVANATAGAVIGIYGLVTNTDGELVMGSLLQTVGPFPVDTTGDKFIDLGGSPFTMPSGQTYGAVGIMIGNDTPAQSFTLAGWNNNGLNSAWSNGVNNIAANTVYRGLQLQYKSWTGTLPTDASSGSYDSTTSYPLALMVQN